MEAAAGLLAALGARAGTEAQVSVAQCNNVRCKNDPARCHDGCVCCVYAIGNNRCLPSCKCRLGVEICPEGEVVDPVRGSVAAVDPLCQGLAEVARCVVGRICVDGRSAGNGVCSPTCTSPRRYTVCSGTPA